MKLVIGPALAASVIALLLQRSYAGDVAGERLGEVQIDPGMFERPCVNEVHDSVAMNVTPRYTKLENAGSVGTAGLSHWGLHNAARSRDGAGSSWYTRAFDFLAEEYAIRGFQIGLGGSWLLPDGTFDRSKCPCSRNGAYGWCSDGTCRNRGGCADVWETMEGGLGYWRNELPTPYLKWRLNNVNGCYAKEMMGVFFDFYGRPINCEDMGFVVVSNRLIMAPDGLSFSNTGSGDHGMLGQAFVRSTVGRTGPSSSDKGGYTYIIVLDAANFAGPVGYTLEEFWKDNKGYSAAPDFSHTKIKIGSTGFEFNGLSAFTSSQDSESDELFLKIPKLQFPVSKDFRTMILTGVRNWNLDDFQRPLEAALEGAQLPSTLLKLAKGSKGRCYSRKSLIALGFKGLPKLDLGGEMTLGQSASGECVSEIVWDSNEMPCTAGVPVSGGSCALPNFWKVSPQQSQPLDFSIIDCAATCAASGYCCNGNTAIGSNQYLSCLQACDIREHGASESTCLGHCHEVAEHRGCSRTINGQYYYMCRTCSDLTSDQKCHWGVDGIDSCMFGCTFRQEGSKTPVVPIYSWSNIECASECKSAGYCCNGNVRTGSNRYLSCLQACDIRKRGATEQICLGHCNEVAQNRGCSRTINGQYYGLCGSCSDIIASAKCTWGVGGKEACMFGCTLTEPASGSGEKTAKPSSASALPSWSSLKTKKFPEKTYGQVPRLDARSGRGRTCMNNPGPADTTVFCVKTSSGSILGFQWYRFVDQPALQRSKLTEKQKRYLQHRIERLHNLLAAEAPLNRWMEAPPEAQPLAELDPSLLVTPPAGFEIGYVPVAVYEGNSAQVCNVMPTETSSQSHVAANTKVCGLSPQVLPILASGFACLLVTVSLAALLGVKWRRTSLDEAVHCHYIAVEHA